MELNFSKKTRKFVASLLAVAILLGVLPVSGLTGSSLGGEENNSSASKIFVKSDYQPVLFNSDGSVESVMTKLDGAENVYTATPKDGDKIGVFDDANLTAGNSVVFFNKKGTDWTSPHIYLWNGGNNNGEFPGAVMTQLSDDVYYSVYPSNTYNKVIFSNGNNKQQTNDLALKDFAVYDSNGILSDESTASYFKCVDYKEANNVYEFTDSEGWKEANVNKPAPNVTISGNGKEVNVIENGIGKDVDYTYYSNQTVVAKASNVNGFTSGEVKYSNNVYSVTYTSNEYKFISYEFKSGTVNLKELPALTVNGEWHVYDNGKEISDDTVVKVTGDEKITAKYELTSAEYQGNKVSEDNLKIALQLNDKDYSNNSEIISADLNSENENILSGTAEYNGQTANIETYTFNCDKAKKVSVDKNDAADGNLYITGTRIYSSEASAEVKIGYVEDAKDYSIKVKSGDSDKNIPSITKTGTKSFSIGNIDKIGDSLVTLTASYTLHRKEISKDFSLYYRNEIKTDKLNITYSNTEKDTTVKDIRTWVSAESAENNPIKVYFDFGSKNENGLIKSINYSDDLKAEYDESIGKWYVNIKKAKTYEFTVTDKVSNTSTITIGEDDLYIDKTAPKITSFKFESASSEKDKLFSFLTFGIYHNDDIKVTVSAVDEGCSSKLDNIDLSGKDDYAVIEKDGNIKCKDGIYTQSFILSSKNGADTAKFNLTATAVDKVGNKVLKLVTDDEVGVIQDGKELTINDKDNFEVIVSKERPKVTVEDSDITAIKGTYKYTDKDDNGKMYFSSGANIKFTVTDKISGINNVKVYLDGDSESGKQLTLTTDSKNDPASYDQLKVKTTFDAFSCSTGDLSEGEHIIRIYAQNNSGNSVNASGYIEKTFYVDKTEPKITSFSFERNESPVDKFLSFVTFGIYHNDEISVVITAEDPINNGISCGVKKIECYNDGKTDSNIEAIGEISYTKDNQASQSFKLKCGEKDVNDFVYHLSAKAVDNVENTPNEQTKITDSSVKVFDNGNQIEEVSKDFEVVATKKKPVVEIKDEDITAIGGTQKYTDENDNNKMYFSSGADIKFTVTDETSGINNVGVYLDGDLEVAKSGKKLTLTTDSKNDPATYDQLKVKTTFDTFSCSTGDLSEGEHTIRIYAQNNSGNNVNGGCVTKTFYVDKTAPKVISFKFEDGSNAGDKLLSFLTFGIYHNDKIKVTVTAEDDASGVGSITLYGAGESKTVKFKNGDNSAEFTLDKSATAYKIYASTTDNVCNAKGYYTFKTKNFDDYRQKNVTFNDKDKNLIYCENKDDVEKCLTEIVSSDQKPVIKDFKLSAINKLDAVNLNGNNWYSSDVKTEFSVDGGLSGINSVKLFVDTYEENAKITEFPQDNDNGADKEISMVTSNESDPNNSTGSSSAVFGYLNDSYFTAQAGKITEAEFNYLTNQKGELSEGKHTITIFVRSNNYEFSCVQKTFYIDRSTPKVTEFTFSPTVTNNSNNEPVENKNAYGYYVNQKTRVTVIANDSKTGVDDVSGVKEIFYKAIDINGNTILNKSQSVNSNNSISFDVEPNFKGYIYAYAVDNVYNGSEDAKYNGKVAGKDESHPDGLVVENGAMHAQSSGITATLPNSSYSANGNPLYSGNITIPVTVTDSYSGIKQIEYSVKSNYDTQNNQAQTVDIANSGNGSSVGGWTVNKTDKNLVTQMSRNITVSNNSNDIVLTVKFTDRAGNKTEIEKKFSIDKTKPVIDVKYDNNEHTTYGGNDYYKADRTATVTVTERNFDESLVEAAIMKNGGRYTTIGGWTHNNNAADPDKSTHIAKIVYNTDGDFTFDIAVKDKAMNSADKFTQQKFTVDKTAPVIEVSFDNNSAKNGNYYKADRTATIKIAEHNFNSGSQYINIPVSAEGVAAPSVVGWSGSGDDHNATVSFNKDGKYSFTVDYTDLAGNTAVQKKVESFYIDKTAPEVEITGVADHQAYNGTVAPVVTYKDDNFTDDHDFKFTRIDINSKSDDTAKFDYDTDGNGVTEFIYKYKDFAEVPENDGIYNFTVELSDKAGNSTSKSVTFSVNRFGSTFMAPDDTMKKLFDNGYTNAEQDIVVEEINVSPITKHSVTLSKSGGNSSELVENKDYKFNASSKGNEWSKNTYTVNKSNFSDEAAYTVTIISVDKAKNTNNNRMADSSLSSSEKTKRECTISFVVDKTNPLVSITGIKDGERYKEASKKVKIVCEDDNLDNSNLEVTLDGKKLAEGKDYTIVDGKDSALSGSLTAEIVLKAETGGVEENLKVTIGDLAGNKGEKSVENFILSANIFQRFFANPVLVICTFAGLALVIAVIIFFIAKKRKKAE